MKITGMHSDTSEAKGHDLQPRKAAAEK